MPGWVGSYKSNPFLLQGWETTKSIVNTAAVELGLYGNSADFDDATNPYVSTDASVMLLCRLLTTCGRELVDMFEWPQLETTFGAETVEGMPYYPMFPGIRSLVPQTAWNLSTRMPMIGPLSEQQWSAITSRQVGVTLNLMFKISYQRSTPPRWILELASGTSTPGGQSFLMQVRTAQWLVSYSPDPVDGLGLPDADAVGTGSLNDDLSAMVVLFDSLLITQMLKMKWLRAKGFDSAQAEADFKNTYERVTSAMAAAPRLSLNGGGFEEPLLGPWNFPFTGYGT